MSEPFDVHAGVFEGPNWELPESIPGAFTTFTRGVDSFAGRANTFVEKWQAERHALKSGRLPVPKPSALPLPVKQHLPTNVPSDLGLKLRVNSLLSAMNPGHHRRLRVGVKDAWITVAGEVDSEREQLKAIIALSRLPGIAGITDHLVVMPELSLEAARAEIRSALGRRSIADAHRIRLTVKGSAITLNGTVRGIDERNLVVYSAWCTPGVRNVFDELEIDASPAKEP
jgi:osmotically-inducible protein OsmY